MTHWATPLIGKPWAPDGEGPDRFSCWGLVRWVFREQYGIHMPPIRVGDFSEGENVASIKRAAEASGWKPAPDDKPCDKDIVLMLGPDGRHVGTMIKMSRGLVLLHAAGHMSMPRRRKGAPPHDSQTPVPVGSVVAQPLRDVLAAGYVDVELWRSAT